VTPEPQTTESDASKGRILLVDDDAPLARTLSRTLSHMGWTVAPPVATGEEAVDRARREACDLVLMDFLLAGPMDGLEAARRIRAGSDVPIVFMTAHADEDFLEAAKQCNPYGYVLKPFTPLTLQATVETALQRARTEAAQRAELRRNARELAIRDRLSAILLTARDERMYDELLAVALEALQSKHGVLGYVDENGALVYAAMTPEVWAECAMDEKRVVHARETWTGIWGKAMTEKRVVRENGGFRVPKGHVAVERALDAPIVHRSRVVGNLLVGNKATDYTDEDADLLQRVSDAIAPVLFVRLQRDRQENSHRRAKRELKTYRAHFEKVVSQRTAELERTSTDLEQEVSERARAERETERVHEYAEGIVDTVREALVVLDDELRVVSANRVFYASFGLTEQEAVGRSIFDLGGGEWNVEGLRRMLEQVLPSNARLVDYEIEQDTGGPAPRTLLLNARQIQQLTSSVQTILLAITDVTERKRLEALVRQAQKMEAIGRLAGGVAHDFNNIITVIKSFGSFVADTLEPSSAAQADMKEILDAADRAEYLTRQLLAFSRRQAVEPRVLSINELIASTEKMLRRLLGEDIELVSMLEQEPWNVRIDPGAFEQVLVNLAVNARDAMPLGGKLTIETANVILDEDGAAQSGGGMPAGEYVVVAVSDSGVGIPRDIQDSIFEPFFTTKAKGKGTGLGLSTCYGIVKQAGGWIWVYSAVDQGTTFKVYLPRVTDAADGLTAPRPSPDLRGTETVLVVEDEEQVRALAVRTLGSLGYTVLEAKDGGEALRLCEQRDKTIDLLLTDVIMPTVGGRELVDSVAALQPDMKVLFMSGYTDEAIAHHGVLEPGTALLQKPFTPVSLGRRVREILDG